ncbi:MAG: hypothetical protein JNJ46_07845 [Myxococcales bacterium]|nr:hypothetical protein [Myxococcales bacterium]
MPKDPKNPSIGDLSIDCTSLADIIVDLPPGAMLGLRQEREGMTEVLTEVANNQKTHGLRAGIADAEAAALAERTAQLVEVRKYLGPARKLVELLEETEAKLDHDRHQHISNMAVSVEQRAKMAGHADLLALYRATRSYRSAPGVKAARTRAKNSENQPQPPSPPPPPVA